MQSQYLTLAQAADYCHKSYEAFRYYMKNGRAPDFVMFGNRKMFTQEALDAWNPLDKRKKNNAN
jgi:hypothetical protein